METEKAECSCAECATLRARVLGLEAESARLRKALAGMQVLVNARPRWFRRGWLRWLRLMV